MPVGPGPVCSSKHGLFPDPVSSCFKTIEYPIGPCLCWEKRDERNAKTAVAYAAAVFRIFQKTISASSKQPKKTDAWIFPQPLPSLCFIGAVYSLSPVDPPSPFNGQRGRPKAITFHFQGIINRKSRTRGRTGPLHLGPMRTKGENKGLFSDPYRLRPSFLKEGCQ